MIIRIKNLKLKAIVGLNDWERKRLQPVTINIAMTIDETAVVQSDDIHDTVDYKELKKRIIEAVETSNFYLIEKLAHHILEIVMQDSNVLRATVELDKPGALRFSDSVSIECSAERHV